MKKYIVLSFFALLALCHSAFAQDITSNKSTILFDNDDISMPGIDSFVLTNNTGNPIVIRLKVDGSLENWLNIRPAGEAEYKQEHENISFDPGADGELRVDVQADFMNILSNNDHDASIDIFIQGEDNSELSIEVVRNRSPKEKESMRIPDVRGLVEKCDSTMAFDLKDHFEDPDGDDLTFPASEIMNTNPEVAVVRINNGSEFWITPLKQGSTTITVEAKDGVTPFGEKSVTANFEIEVNQNNAPQVDDSYSPPFNLPANFRVAFDVTPLEICSGNATIDDLRAIFKEDDGCDSLSFEVGIDPNSSAGVAEVEKFKNAEGRDGLRVNPIGTGSTIVVVEATDLAGNQAEYTFDVEVASNIAPAPNEVIISDTLTVATAAVEKEYVVSNLFEDDDGEDLSYDAASLIKPVNPNLRVSVVTDDKQIIRVVLEPEFEGPRGEIVEVFMVKARDECGSISVQEKTVSFLINRAPKVVNRFKNFVFRSGKIAPINTLELGMKDTFDDEDDDSLIFAPTSDAPEIASVSIRDDTLIVEFKDQVGVANITIEAKDPKKGAGTTGFSIEIINSNRPPAVKNTIDDITLVAAQDVAFELNLYAPDTIFFDQDRDELVFSAQSSNKEIAIASIVDFDILRVEPLSPSKEEVIITVFADDKNEGKDSTSFKVTVVESKEPKFRSLSFATQSKLEVDGNPVEGVVGEAVLVNATIEDDFDIPAVTLWYRTGGSKNAFIPTRLIYDESSSTETLTFEFNGRIPAEFVSSRGVEYRLSFKDLDNDSMTYPKASIKDYNSIQVFVPDRGAIMQERIHTGRDQRDYNLMSFPLALQDTTVGSIFDELGPQSNREWKLFEPKFNGSDIFLPPTATITRGKAYWLITRKLNPPQIDTGPGFTIRTDTLFTIPLSSGWNYIGSPFNFDILVASNLTYADRTIIPAGSILEYDAGQWLPVDTVSAFKGYALFATGQSGDSTLLINPNLSFTPPQSISSKPVLQFSILAETNRSEDRFNVSVIDIAERDFDFHDQPEPPHFGEYVSVYAPHREWGQPVIGFTTDARPMFVEGETWEFEVVSSAPEQVTLTFDGVRDIPTDYEVWLIDEAVGIAKNLRETRRYVVAGRGPETPKKLKIIAGKADFTAASLAGVTIVPADFELSQNFPNPFNPSTTIRYALPEKSLVTMKIYNVLGELIRTLIAGEHVGAGYHTAVWDGRDDFGRTAASGIYIYIIRAGEFSGLRKMALVK